MKVKVTKAFNWAEDGNHLRTVKVGEVLEGRGALVALQLSSGEEVREPQKPPAPEPGKKPEPQKGK
jgi:hypothetical protein